MKSLYLHAKNKFFGKRVDFTGSEISVWDQDGTLLCAIGRDGAGNLIDKKDMLGAKFAWNQSPIQKTARVYKADIKTGAIILDELHAERIPVAKELVEKYGYVPAEGEIK